MLRTFLDIEEILTGPHNFRGLFEGLDMVLSLRDSFRSGLGLGVVG